VRTALLCWLLLAFGALHAASSIYRSAGCDRGLPQTRESERGGALALMRCHMYIDIARSRAD